MTYILMIYTIVALGPNPMQASDWRPIGEFHYYADSKESAQERCEAAARQLGIKSERYRCVRSK
jgi:hypothetical protein